MPVSGRFDKYGGSLTPEDIPWDKIGRGIWMTCLGAAVVVVVFVLSSTFYDIEAGDEGVVLRFGKQVDTVSPGLHWKLPWPIETVYKVPVERIQSLEFGFQTRRPGRITRYAPQSSDDLMVAEMLTGDLNLGHVEWIVQYRVKDSSQFLFNLGNTDPIGQKNWPREAGAEVNPAVPDTIRDVSESVMRKLVGDVSIDYVLTIGRDQLARNAEQMIQEELDSFKTGVDIVTVKLQTTSPPTEEVQEAFQEVNRSRQKKERVMNEALGERNSKIPAARGQRDRSIAEAEGYRSKILLETSGKVKAFLAQLAEYQKAPTVTRQRLYLETMEKILGDVGSKIIIDDTISGVLPLLDLDAGAPRGKSEKGVGP